MVDCPYCTTEEKLIIAIKRAISDSKKGGREEFAKKLEKVLAFLPEWPIMAILEAQALSLPDNFIIMLQDSFSVLPLGN